jgi:hypothetical protein
MHLFVGLNAPSAFLSDGPSIPKHECFMACDDSVGTIIGWVLRKSCILWVLQNEMLENEFWARMAQNMHVGHTWELRVQRSTTYRI